MKKIDNKYIVLGLIAVFTIFVMIASIFQGIVDIIPKLLLIALVSVLYIVNYMVINKIGNDKLKYYAIVTHILNSLIYFKLYYVVLFNATDTLGKDILILFLVNFNIACINSFMNNLEDKILANFISVITSMFSMVVSILVYTTYAPEEYLKFLISYLVILSSNYFAVKLHILPDYSEKRFEKTSDYIKTNK